MHAKMVQELQTCFKIQPYMNMSQKKSPQKVKHQKPYAGEVVTPVKPLRLACNSKPLSLNSATVDTEGASWSASQEVDPNFA